MEKKIVQTAGRKQLGKFAPEFVHFNEHPMTRLKT